MIGLFSACLLADNVPAEDYRTPRAGEEYNTELWSMPVTAPKRDRRRVTALTLGAQYIPNGPSSSSQGQDYFQPIGALYVWRHPEDNKQRFRGVISGLFNDLRYNLSPEFMHERVSGAEFVFTFENLNVPFGRPETGEGKSIDAVELEWQYVRAGLGLGYRTLIGPGHQDNTLEWALTYEPGYLWFDRSKDTAQNFITPQDTYEGRVHFRLRADAMERNIMELAHQGFSTGMDLIYGHRSNWEQWGGPVFGPSHANAQQNYFAASAYMVAANGIPGVKSDRHRLLASAYAGTGKNLDRFSAFRISSRPTTWEWEALSIPDLPGVAFGEFFSRSYGLIDLRYRYEALFFVYPYLRGTMAWIDRPRLKGNGQVGNQMDSLPSLGAGLITGAPGNSEISLDYSYNFGILRNTNGSPQFGGHSLILAWSMEF
ncbi:MAG: hypothetical protein ACXV7F_03515 [Methylomonas sp.]